MLQESDWFDFLKLNEVNLALFEWYVLFFVILIFSIISKNILLRRNYGGFSKVIFYMRYVGVWIHEISHYFACLAVGFRPTGLSVKYKYDHQPNPHGSVSISDKSFERLTFLQSVIICFAPLIVSTWIVYFSLTILLTPVFDPFLRIFAGFLCISCFLGACPSNADFGFIPRAFKRDPLHSFYQIFLLSLSFLASLFLLNLNAVLFENFFFYYIIVIVFYVIFKYGFILVKISALKLKSYTNKGKTLKVIGFKPFTRRTARPLKPKNIGIKESPW